MRSITQLLQLVTSFTHGENENQFKIQIQSRFLKFEGLKVRKVTG